MEALVLIFGEFLFSLLGGLVLMMAEGVLLLFSSLFCWFGWGWKKKSAEGSPAPEEQRRSTKWTPPKGWIAVQRGLVAVLICTLISAVLINTVFLEPALRAIAGVIGRNTEMELSFAKASGSLLPGRLLLHGVSVQKTDTTNSNFSVSAEKIDVTFNIFSLLGKTADVDGLKIEGLNGTFTRAVSQNAGAHASEQKSLKARRTFSVSALRLQQASVVLVDISEDGSRMTLPVIIDRLEALPLRSSHAVFDILFRSSAAGMIAGQPFSIQTQSVPGGRATQWKTQDLPVSLLSHFVGKPFDLLQEGVVDVDVEDYWSLKEQAEIEMHWSLVFREVVAAVPPSLDPWEKVFAEPVVEYINGRPENISIRFDVVMNENEFKGAASLDAAGLWNTLSRAFVKEVSSRLDISSDQLKSGMVDGYGRFKRFLDEKRKSKSDRSD